FIVVDAKHPEEGLALAEEALPLVRKDKTALFEYYITVLSLLYTTDNEVRARVYEEEADNFLRLHGTAPGIRPRRHRLQLSLGQVAYSREDYPTAYWYLAQAAESIADPAVDEKERRGWESGLQLQVARTCLRTRRFYECQEALDLAEKSTTFEAQKLRVAVLRSDLLRQLGYLRQAADLLASIADDAAKCDEPDVPVRHCWAEALVALDTGNASDFQRLRTKAMEAASEHRRHYLLREIERFHCSTLEQGGELA
ncbi:MAG: hypothetical protein K0R39_4299, partial [Symbiobacteriaceae bacterium]|nr:hypothetical protein [Symbiobacteriaceae bacterium]